MNHIRYFLGWWIVVLAERLASLAHQICHAGAWCMDVDVDDCAQCQAQEEDNEPMDGPWAI